MIQSKETMWQHSFFFLSVCQASSGAMADLPEKDTHAHHLDLSLAFIEHCDSLAVKALEVKLEYTPVLYCRALFFDLISFI